MACSKFCCSSRSKYRSPKPVGIFMTVFNGERTLIMRPDWLTNHLSPYGVTKREMHDRVRRSDVVVQSRRCFRFIHPALARYLPFNPQKLPGVDSSSSATGGFVASAFNTAASFTSNTNWQSYVPEVTMSYLTQMVGLAYHNFGSAATGIVAAIALIRGIATARTTDDRKFLGRFCALQSLCVAARLCPRRIAARLPGRNAELRPYERRSCSPQTIEVDKKDAAGNVLTNPTVQIRKKTTL